MTAVSVPRSSFASVIPGVVPHWEWRTFERDADNAIPWAPVHDDWDRNWDSEETYLVSYRTPHNVKVRRGRLQIKHLDRVARDGLELWRPAFDISFPVLGALLEPLCTALGIPMIYEPRRSYTAGTLVAATGERVSDLRVVPVAKRRTTIPLAHGQGEHVTLRVLGTRWYSLAFEDADPDHVRTTVHTFGLQHLPNVSYPAFLKARLTRETLLHPRQNGHAGV